MDQVIIQKSKVDENGRNYARGDSTSHLTNLRCPRKKYQLIWLLVAHSKADPVPVTVPLTVPKRSFVKVMVFRFFAVPSMIVLLCGGVGYPRVRVH